MNVSKAFFQQKKCIEQVIRYIYDLDFVTDVIELSYKQYIDNKKELLSKVDKYNSMNSYNNTHPHIAKVYFEGNGDIVKDDYIDKMINVDDDLSCEREQYIVFVLTDGIKISDTYYNRGSLVIVKHLPVRSLTMHEKHIAKILNIK